MLARACSYGRRRKGLLRRRFPSVDEISITIAFALLGLTWLTLRGMDGRSHRRHRR